MKKRLIVLMALATGFSGFSQEAPVKKDYVVIKSDTVYGIFKMQNFENTPATVSFKKSASDSWVDYGPADISAFSVFGFSFESHKVVTDFASINLTDLMNNQQQKKIIDTLLFLKVEIKNNIMSL